MSSSSPQRHQHGVKKKLVEGIGGVLVGTALVLLMRGIFKRRTAAATQNGSTTQATAGDSA